MQRPHRNFLPRTAAILVTVTTLFTIIITRISIARYTSTMTRIAMTTISARFVSP